MKKINNIIILVSALFSFIYCMFFIESSGIYDVIIKDSFILLLFVPKILRRFKINISDVNELVYILFVILAQLFGSIMNFYGNIYWYDTLCHFISGIVVSSFAFELMIKGKYKLSNFGQFIFILGCSCTIAVMWEMFEFTGDNLFGKDAQRVLKTGVTDTMKDLIVAFLGSILFNISYLFEKVNNKKLVLTKFKNKIEEK